MIVVGMIVEEEAAHITLPYTMFCYILGAVLTNFS